MEALRQWKETGRLGQEVEAYTELLPRARQAFAGAAWERSWQDWDQRWQQLRTELEPRKGAADWPDGLPVDAPGSASFTNPVRAILLALLAAWVGSGCSTPGPGGSRSRTDSGVAASPSDGASAETGNRLDERVQGKVIVANSQLRFVVMEFPLRRMPALEQRLNVYREAQKVGEVKVSGPVRDTTIAGDVMVGEARVGDEVRED